MNPKRSPRPASVPKPPSAKSLAEAQMGASRDAAGMQFGFNAVNQRTPFGNMTYSQRGRNPDGTPRYEVETSMSPDERRIYNRFNNLTGRAMGNVRDVISSPFKLGNEETEARLMELGGARLNPEFDRRRSQLESQLYNQGVRPGTEAYREAMAGLGRDENDARNQLLLTGRGQAANEMLMERNQPMSELMRISGLRTGGINTPQFVNTPNVSIDTPNVGDYAFKEYQYGPLANHEANEAYRLREWQADEKNRQAMMGGIMGLGGAALAGPLGMAMGPMMAGMGGGMGAMGAMGAMPKFGGYGVS